MPVSDAVDSPTSRRDRIIDSALDHFARHGVAATTVDQIRRTAGVSIGAFYHHFHGKDDLAVCLFLDGAASLHHAVVGTVATLDAWSAVRGGVVAHLRWGTENPLLARFMFETRIADLSGPRMDEVRFHYDSYIETFQLWLVEQMDRGTVRRMSLPEARVAWFGPTHEFLRATAPDELAAVDPVSLGERLAADAWRALRAVPDAPPAAEAPGA